MAKQKYPLSTETIEKARILAEKGYSRSRIAKSFGITYNSFNYYFLTAEQLLGDIHAGKIELEDVPENRQLMIALYRTVIEAEMGLEGELLEVVKESAVKRKQTKDAKWLLAKIDPDRYGERQTIKQDTTLHIPKGSDEIQDQLNNMLRGDLLESE